MHSLDLQKLMLRLACLVLALTWGTTAQAQFLLTGNSGAEWQIGTGLPLPIGPNGIYTGGMDKITTGTNTGGPARWPDLLVPPNPDIQYGLSPTRTIMQDLATAQGGQVVVPAGALSRPAPGAAVPIAVFNTNPAVFQVATSVDYQWPSATATFAPGGAPGPVNLGTAGGGVIAYSGGTKSFGGAGQFSFSPGPNAGTVPNGVPPNTLGVQPVASVWINAFQALPASVMTIALVGASAPNGTAQPGAPVASPPISTMFGAISTMGFRAVNLTTPITCCDVGPNGSIFSSLAVGGPGLDNKVTASKGFPWTTGFITVSQPGAVPPEIFYLSGTDMRVSGVGNLSMVSGALSLRALSGPNANRGWVSLRLTTPEPSAALAGAGALVMLGVCHTLVRRRRSS